MDGMDYVLHSPEPSSSQHQAPGSSCPFMNRPDGIPHPGPSRPTSFYDPVHGPSGPWLSPLPYQWPHPPSGLPPHAHSQPGSFVPSPDVFYPPVAVTPLPPTHHTSPSFGVYPYPGPYSGPGEVPNFRPPPSNHRMSAPSGLSGPPSSSQPGSPTQPAQSSQHNWSPRPFGGMSPPGSLRYSASHRRHDGPWGGSDSANPLGSHGNAYHTPHGQDHPYMPQVFHAPSYHPSSSRPEPLSPRGNISFGGSLRPGQPTDGPIPPGASPPNPNSSQPQSTAAASPSPPSFPSSSSSERRRPPPSRHRRPFSRIYSERDREGDEDMETVLMEQIMNAHPGGMDNANLRAAQFFRGSVSTKMVASPAALRSLESVDLAEIPKEERICVICYNEYGEETPEGVKEAALRLPKCKHIFGDHCIKKWFEDSDSCPYCRDRLPSEPRIQATSRAFLNFLRMRNPNATTQVDSDTFVRAMTRVEAERQVSGRRSPPSDSNGSDYRRRIRARHGSRGSGSPPATGNRPSSFTGPLSSTAPAPAQPRNERSVNLPPYRSLLDSRSNRPTTPRGTTLSGTGPRMGGPTSYQAVRFADADVPSPPSMLAEGYGEYSHPTMRLGPVYPNPLSNATGNSAASVPAGMPNSSAAPAPFMSASVYQPSAREDASRMLQNDARRGER